MVSFLAFGTNNGNSLLKSVSLNLAATLSLGFLLATLGCGGGGGSSSGSTTTNTPPVATAGADQVVVQGESVTLNGSSSSDSDGLIDAYQWVQTEGTPVDLTGANMASSSFIVPDTDDREDLTFQLTVTDDEGAQDSDTVSITVNLKPVVDAGPDQFAYDNRAITLEATATDSDGTIVDRQWTQTGGIAVDLDGETTPTLNFTTPSTTTGTLTFSYTATDNDEAQQTDTVSVHVGAVLFSDSFDNVSSLDDWNVVDDSGNPSDWDVTAGELYQQDNVNDLAFLDDSSYHTGTFAYLDGAAFTARSAFRFSVDVTPRINGNGDREGNDVGIMFPYAATNNYFRLSMNARYGFTRLERRQGSVFRTLAVNSIGYVDDQPVTMTVEVNENTIVVLIDDDPVFAETNLTISPGTVALYCQDKGSFDNVVISENSPQTMAVVSSPIDYSITLTPGAGDDLDAQAVVLNQPVDGSVGFSLDGGSEIDSTVSGSLYSTLFSAVATGEHDVAAIARDADGNELNRDTNFVVGTGGDYLIAVGDSITNGVQDEDPSNNDSSDGRIVSMQGFQAKLADELTASSGLPQIVFNEGIPGELSGTLDGDRIDSILERHPRANAMLLLIGTNDSWTVSADDYESHVTSIANAALAEVDRVYIARIPPRYDKDDAVNATLNSRIVDYNIRILQITGDSPDDAIYPGPDFYTIFEDNKDSYYADGLHPNDAGYQAMADAWHTILSSP